MIITHTRIVHNKKRQDMQAIGKLIYFVLLMAALPIRQIYGNKCQGTKVTANGSVLECKATYDFEIDNDCPNKRTLFKSFTLFENSSVQIKLCVWHFNLQNKCANSTNSTVCICKTDGKMAAEKKVKQNAIWIITGQKEQENSTIDLVMHLNRTDGCGMSTEYNKKTNHSQTESADSGEGDKANFPDKRRTVILVATSVASVIVVTVTALLCLAIRRKVKLARQPSRFAKKLDAINATSRSGPSAKISKPAVSGNGASSTQEVCYSVADLDKVTEVKFYDVSLESEEEEDTDTLETGCSETPSTNEIVLSPLFLQGRHAKPTFIKVLPDISLSHKHI